MNLHPATVRWSTLTVLAAACLAAPLSAAGPRDEVLRLVPADVGVCLLVHDLRGHTAALKDSPFLARLRKSGLGVAIGTSPEAQQLAAVEKALKEHFDLKAEQLRDDILGDAVVMAFRPGPPGSEPNQEQVLFVLWARDDQLLAKLIERFNAVQKKAGDLEKLEECSHEGVKYFRRVEKGKPPFYYRLNGHVLAAASQEEMLRQAIDLDRKSPAAEKAEPPLAKKLRDLQADTGLLALWINPRAFDADLEKKAADAKAPAEAAVLKQFLVYWKALDDVALFMNVRQSLDVGLTAKARTTDLPPAAQKFLASASQPSELWGAFPADALLAVAGRVEFAALVDVLADFLTPDARQGLRNGLKKLPANFAENVLPNLGPDLGFCVTVPAANDRDWFPHLLWALRVQPGPGAVPVGQTVFDTLNFYANFGVLNQKQKWLEFKTVMQDKVEVRYFADKEKTHFPPGVQPAYALKAGYLVFASAPEVIRRFEVAAGKAPANEVPLARASLRALQDYLKGRRDNIITFVAERNGGDKEAAGRQLDAFAAGLQLFDAVELTQRAGAGQTVLTLRVRTAEPLRK